MLILIALSNAARYTRECRIKLQPEYNMTYFDFVVIFLWASRITVHAGRRNACKREKVTTLTLTEKRGVDQLSCHLLRALSHPRTVHKSRKILTNHASSIKTAILLRPSYQTRDWLVFLPSMHYRSMHFTFMLCS